MSAIKLELAEENYEKNEQNIFAPRVRMVASGLFVVIRRESVESVEQGKAEGCEHSFVNTANSAHVVVGNYTQIAERCGL